MPALETLPPHEKDLGGGFMVRRSLPSPRRQAVGPFVFFDHFGPVTALPGDNFDVRPHPHIGLATVSYLFEGAMMHRDSTGVVQRIEPGAINLMTAGRGIVHSERTPEDLRAVERRSHGLQLWLAVPAEHEEDAPGFQHVPGAEIPAVDVNGVRVRVLIGSAFGLRSPVATKSPTLYLDLSFAAGASLTIPDAAQERALYSVDHDFTLDGTPVPAFTMVVLEPGSEPVLSAPPGGRIVLVGGAPLGPRFIVWNFVSSRKERIAQAQDDWEAFTSGRAAGFEHVPGETEFIPLPPRRP
ncbi:MAG TPA: pirin family protein [Burkholderiaceae bacterium]|nr:pirin family protein [Burkholderiaceae bacterium]